PVLGNGHAGFGGRSGETHQRQRWQSAPGRPNKAAGDALGIDLLNNPYLVEQDAAVAWKTALWYWNTQTGPGTMTPHHAMVSSAGFGETIRSINGSLECNGGNPGQVQSRINSYTSFVQILGTTPGANLSC
ncbi:chitinase, partial [Streptomyces nigrescens]|uniref:chitinase n=1 Tax=Streptomyces nigrescens TaxID=1920 RepID=UPI0036FEB98F